MRRHLNLPPKGGVWTWIAEPRIVTVTITILYALLGAAGAVAILAPPEGVVGALGVIVLVRLWAFLLVVGAVLATLGALPGWWYVERAGLIGCASGLGMYTVAVSRLDTLVEVRSVRIFLVAALVAALVNRWARIASSDLDPSRLLPPGGRWP